MPDPQGSDKKPKPHKPLRNISGSGRGYPDYAWRAIHAMADKPEPKMHALMIAFGSDLEREGEDEDKDLEGLSDAEKEWHEEFEEHYQFEPPTDFEWEEAKDYGIEVPKGGLDPLIRSDLARLYSRSSPVDEAIWYAVNAYHWHEADWLEVLNSERAFDAFMRMQEKYYKSCLTDSQLVGQTAECAGIEQTKAAMKKSEDVFGGL